MPDKNQRVNVQVRPKYRDKLKRISSQIPGSTIGEINESLIDSNLISEIKTIYKLWKEKRNEK